ncbi:MAG: uncharacterized protein JWR07_3489 [Nevskia sp.]|nr:uncharacterized protein [Nevskia sp.]
MRDAQKAVRPTQAVEDHDSSPDGASAGRAGFSRALRVFANAVVWTIGFLFMSAPWISVFADAAKEQPAPVKLAVFDFELDDISAGASNAGEKPSDIALLKAVSEKARQVMVQSGRYSLVDTAGADVEQVKGRSLKTCDGCEAAIALQLGAEQSLLGVVTRVEMSSYAVRVQIRDARTGKLVNQQSAVFLGSDDGWSNGAASLLRHRVLSNDYPP